MSRRRKLTDTTPFDTLRLEGTLFVPELLERAASGDATAQKEADYAIPRGLKIHDEYGRAFRIAAASWQAFVPQLARTDLDPVSTTQTFVLGFLRQCLDYVDITPLLSPVQLGDRAFPISAQAIGGRLHVIIAPHNLGLDDPDQSFAILGSGTRRKSAHQLAQEFLNADRNSLWAIVTNGKILRLLRDADTLTRPNFLEFDLETILRDEQQRYADFAALWRMLHASRAGAATASSSDCIWEKWKSEGHAQGLRIRDGLRDGVQEALLILGTGFITHRENDSLRLRLHDGVLTKEDYFQQLLRLIYRCLFLFCSEERDLLHPQDASTTARQAYATGYSLRRLRTRSLRQSAHDPHGDLWQSVRITFTALASGQPRLGLPALGGLFAQAQCSDLDSASLTNRDLLSAMKHLRWFFDKKTGQRGAIDYRNMGPEELGSVYESLLELVPQLDLPARAFGFAGITDSASTSGNARKTTGSYYTPDSLVQELIKSALDPVIADRLAAQPDRPIDALLSITVCDPSCGSGHFLLAAARRLAEKLAELRAPDGAVRPDDYRHALREVASRCLYGVDINPMAVELCRVALWLETVDPGKPLGFLNHHIRTGNSLLGTTPDLIAAGLPDDTFTAIEGDDKAACAELKKRNKKEREGFGPLFEQEEQSIRDHLRHAATQIEAMDDSQPAALQQKEAAFTTSEIAPEYRHAKLLADLWCAAFVIKKHYPLTAGEAEAASPPISTLLSPIEGHLLHTEDDLFGQPKHVSAPKAVSKKQPRTANREQGTPWGITTAHLRDFVQGKPLPANLQAEVEELARQYRFFHWHLAFPQVFDQGGFACILGNPPWERVKIQEKEWFAEKRPEIASAANASARKRLIEQLEVVAPGLLLEFRLAIRQADAESHFLRNSFVYPLCGRGDVNLYTVFAETMCRFLCPNGRSGSVLPSGIATDDTTKTFFQSLVDRAAIISLLSFENEEFIFPGVHHSTKFCLLCLSGSASQNKSSRFLFYARRMDEIGDPARCFEMTPDDFLILNPVTRTCPVLRGPLDLALLRQLYSKSCLLEDSNQYAGQYIRLIHLGDDAEDVRLADQLSEGQFNKLYEYSTA
ncbi:Eco57I restriction-modification methylase domain-containing protein, partial [Prosthecobacter sp.]|uniref:Eco57I restriction-modification methylase domain-containing protein n=1 Tax=Prosthecobacter sp. TaxID=1965333 RepID=UPI0037CC32DD